MAADTIVIPDIVAFILFGIITGSVLGIIMSFMFRSTAFFFAGLFSGVIVGVLIHWISKRNPQIAHAMPDVTPAAAPLSDLQHVVNSFERIFQTWASHSNVTDLCFFGAIIVIAVLVVKVTRIQTEARHPPYYDPRYHDLRYPPPLPPGLEQYYQPRQLEDHRPPEEGRNLPAVRRSDDARTI